MLSLAADRAVAQEPAPPTFSETIDVRVVELEVEVVDRQGVPVVGLPKSEFKLFVDGERREIDYFSETEPRFEVDRPGLAEVSPPEDASPVRGPESLNLLVFVDENNSLRIDLDRTLGAIAGDLAMLRPSDRLSIVAWNGRRIERLLPWTSPVDPAVARVLAAMRERPANGLRERMAFDWVGAAPSFDSNCARDPSACMSTPGSRARPGDRLRALEIQGKLERIATVIATTLRASPPPAGRRIAALLSGGWTSEVIEPGDMLDAWTPLLQAADQLRYTLYTVDVPGMSAVFSAGVDREEDGMVGSGMSATTVVRAAPTGAIVSGADAFSSLPARSGLDETLLHSTLYHLAEETGGAALINAGRRELVPTASTRARSYYSIGFSAQQQGDGERHEIEVRLRDASHELRYRRAFQDLDRPTEIRIALETAMVDPTTASSAFSVELGKLAKRGKNRILVPMVLRLEDGDAERERTFDFQLVAEDDEGRRTEVGPVEATLRRRRPTDAVRGGELEMELRNAAHRLAIGLRDRSTDELFVASVELSP